MNNSKQRLTCAQVRAGDMVDYLSGLGHYPTKINGNNYWYLSPLRSERTPSFKINRKLNRWYDHGLSKGGNLIDFAILYHKCTVGALLQNITGSFCFHPATLHQSPRAPEENKIQVLHAFIISSVTLVNYLKERRIPLAIAGTYCREVRYQFKQKIYYAIGFKNDAGGYELRNPYCKNSSAPKSVTTIKNGANKIAVFEGFFDFLSFIVLNQNEPSFQWDFCILNSISFFERSRPFLEQYNSIHLFLDNDTAGQNCSRAAIQSNKNYVNENNLYKGYKDLNEWLINRNGFDEINPNNIPP